MALLASYTDEQLVALLKERDRQAFSEIYNRYWLSLYNTAEKRLKNQSVCEDIVQDIFVSLWTKRSELEVNNLAAYLHTAVRYRVLNHLQRSPEQQYFFIPFEEIH